jgi:hypothetical protein
MDTQALPSAVRNVDWTIHHHDRESARRCHVRFWQRTQNSFMNNHLNKTLEMRMCPETETTHHVTIIFKFIAKNRPETVHLQVQQPFAGPAYKGRDCKQRSCHNSHRHCARSQHEASVKETPVSCEEGSGLRRPHETTEFQ